MIFKGPLFHKLVTFFCCFLQQTGSSIAYFNKNNGVWKYAYYNLLTGMYAVAAQGHKANFLIFHNRVNLDDIRYYHVNNIIYYPVQLGEPNSRDGNAICHSM